MLLLQGLAISYHLSQSQSFIKTAASAGFQASLRSLCLGGAAQTQPQCRMGNFGAPHGAGLIVGQLSPVLLELSCDTWAPAVSAGDSKGTVAAWLGKASMAFSMAQRDGIFPGDSTLEAPQPTKPCSA